MAYKRISPGPVVEGYTGKQSFTAYAVITGGTTSTGALQNTVGAGTAGQILVSGGAAALPVWTAASSASSITLTGDTGGALTSNSFTLTAGTTGLSFGGAGTTETLSGTLVVSNGGTGRATLTAHDLLIGNGTTAVTLLAPSATTGIPLISQGAASDPAFGTAVVAGGGTGNTTFTAFSLIAAGTTATGAFQNVVGTGTTGQILVATTGALPVWTAAGSASSISITGNTGGALTGNAFTFSGGTTGLSFGGSGSTETLSGTLVVANGGTGVASFNINGAVFSNTTTTGALSAATLTSGQLLIGGTTTPAAASLTAGAGISITPGNNSITISSIGAGVTWSIITVNQTAVVENGYFCNKAGTLALALPAASAVGDVIEVTNENTALGVQFTQAAGQQILIASTNTTSGATGTLTSSAVGDTLKIVCKVANTIWRVTDVIGNWTPA